MLCENYIIPKIPLINKSANFRSIKQQQKPYHQKKGINTVLFPALSPKQCEYLKEREGREENSLDASDLGGVQVCPPLRQVSLFPEFYIPPYLI